jgi:hypothetical protein
MSVLLRVSSYSSAAVFAAINFRCTRAGNLLVLKN